MTPLCAPSPYPGLPGQLLALADCQAAGLAERGYAALALAGSEADTALTGLMAIAVALFGYRLLLGRGLALADALGLALKLGLVLVLVSQWSAWQGEAYDLLARAPTRIGSTLVASLGARDPIAALTPAITRLDAAAALFRAQAGAASPLIGGPAGAAMALGASSLLLTLTTVGILVAARVVLALLIALTPLMAGLLLFAPTRGLAQGWARAMIAAALAPVAVLAVGAIEMATLTPMLARLAELNPARPDAALATGPALVTLLFGLATLAATRALARIAGGLRLPTRGVEAASAPETVPARDAQLAIAARAAVPAPLAVARALEASARRDGRAGQVASRDSFAPTPAMTLVRQLRTPLAAAPMFNPAALAPLARQPRTTRADTLRDAR